MNTQEQKSKTKPCPKAGMRVTWVNPNSKEIKEYDNSDFVKFNLIEAYGRKGLEIASAEQRGGRWLVVLNRNGNRLEDESVGSIDWYWLRPLSRKEIKSGCINVRK